jgi:hypothetical protein
MSILLPVSESPVVYYFRLFLHELYRDFVADRKICLITDAAIIDFSEPGWHPHACGTNEAVSFNKDVQSSPTYFSSIPKSVIAQDVILSRQLIGTKFTLDAQAVYPTRQIYPLMTGIIGSVTSDDFSCKLELVSENEKLKTQGVLKVSQDCMNTLGIGKCTVSNPTISAQVDSVVNRDTIELTTPFVTAFDSSAEYEVTVGTTSYLINKSLSTTSSLKIIGSLSGKPQFVKIRKHCNQSLSQCARYSNLHQFNGSPFLTSSVLNVVL